MKDHSGRQTVNVFSDKPYTRVKSVSPRKRLAMGAAERLEVGGEIPTLSPEQQVALQDQLFTEGSESSLVPNNLTIAQLRQMSKADAQLQKDRARQHTASVSSASGKKKRTAPVPPAPITAEQRARGRLLRYISLYENEYRDEILEYMYKMQDATMPSRTAMEQQTEIELHMRPALIDFMVELHGVFHLRQETLYLGINILDRYCSRRMVNKKHYQLVGCTALWIASKFEDSKDHVPTTGDLKQYCRDVYEETSFIQMEGHVLTTINWELGHPTCEAWFRNMVNTLDRSGSEAGKEMAIRQGWVGLPELETRGVPIIQADLTTQCIARYLMELMIYLEALIDVHPSVIAEAALILAKVINWKSRERETESTAALHVARYLHDLLSRDLEWISQTLINKYKQSLFERASIATMEFYLKGRGENALRQLEDLPEFEQKMEDEEKKVPEADADASSDGAAAAGFEDSGYASAPSDEAIPIKKEAKDALAAGVRSSPTPSSPQVKSEESSQ